MPGVLTCRHREKGLLEGGLDGLDPRIVAYITDAGLDGLLRVPHMDLDHSVGGEMAAGDALILLAPR